MNKLQQLLNLLNKEEKKELMELLNPNGSSEFNALALCLEFYLQSPQVPDSLALSGTIRPGKPFQQNAIDQIESRLLSKIQDFLVLQKLKTSPPEFQLHLVEELNRRGEVKYIDYYIRKASKTNKQLHDQSPESYLHEFQVEMEQIKNKVSLGERHIQEDLANAQLALDQFYWLKSLQIQVAMEGASKFVAGGVGTDTNGETNSTRIMKALAESKLHQALATVERMLLDRDADAAFEELLPLALQEPPIFSSAIVQDLCHHLLNHCVRRLRGGNQSFGAYYEELTNRILEAGVQKDRENMRPGLLKNHIERALQMEETTYAQKLLDKYGKNIHSKFREAIVAYNEGVIAFYDGRFRDANHQFLKLNLVFKVDDIFYQIDAKVYWIWSSLLISETNGLDRSVHAFKKFLRDSKLISAGTRSGYLELTNYILKIYRWRRHRKEPAKRVQALQSEIENAQNLPKKKLLLLHLHQWTGYP